ncbi:MAG TPA: hypothetical protein VG223_15990 [Solirubrobacteraceae bacterium]|jgi:hypothetical protein|nr:hypothetical protein [Solirubrobacteraceae bacterium]
MLVAVALVSGGLVAGCGGSSPGPTAATVGGAITPAPTLVASGRAASSPSTAHRASGSGLLALAKCMRSNGAPNFPDPKGLSVAVDIRPGPIGVAFNGPAFRRAQAKCRTAKPHPLAMSRGH